MFGRETLDRLKEELIDCEDPIERRGEFEQLRALISIRTKSDCRLCHTCPGLLTGKLPLSDSAIQKSPQQPPSVKQSSTSCHMQRYFSIDASNAWAAVWYPVVAGVTIVKQCFGVFPLLSLSFPPPRLLGTISQFSKGQEQFPNFPKVKNNFSFLSLPPPLLH